ncbi:MAG: RadC family protein [Bacteroidota bacterium]
MAQRTKRKKKTAPAQYHTTIKDWAEGERPREKLQLHGSSALSEAELLAILIRTGTRGVTAVDLAKKLLSDGRTLRDVAGMSLADIEQHGIGRARATAIVAALELARRLPSSDGKSKPVVRAPADVAERFGAKLRDLKHEEFWVVLLNAANQLLQEARITSGTLNASLVHPRECFHAAIREKAASVLFVHNHPSGNPEPSHEDISMTKQLVEAGRILDIPVQDHIIIAGARYTSLAERGLI